MLIVSANKLYETVKRYIFFTYFLLSKKVESIDQFSCLCLNLDQLYITYAKLLAWIIYLQSCLTGVKQF